ncbi:MAG TPA: hypothetical protein VH142_13795 [Polyangiaceae bacterium]|nr:hypothetical protein [Polyangiaceae bacterium]
MKRTPSLTTTIRISCGAALCALFAGPIACSSDNSSGGSPEAGTTGGETSSGGSASGGKTSTGGTTSATGGTNGSGGTVAGTGGTNGGSGGAATGGSTGSGGSGGTGTGGSGGSAEAGTPDGGVACGAPANAADAKVCLSFDPEKITELNRPDLDGQGTLIIQAFDTATPSDTTEPLKTIFYPPPTDAGLATTDVYSLPQIDIDGLPETAYIRVLFVDNPAWFLTQSGLTYGMFIGGFDLTQGVLPPPALRALPLTKGKGTLKVESLTALRLFTTTVKLMDGVTPADDGQGPMSVGAFDVAAAAGQPVLGGVQLPCTDITKGPVDVSGFLYGDGDFWLIGQLDDFNQGGLSKPGSIVSLGGGTNGQSAPDSQKVTVAADQYSLSVPLITLNFVIPGSTGFAHYACPGSGSDAGAPDGGH